MYYLNFDFMGFSAWLQNVQICETLLVPQFTPCRPDVAIRH